MTQEEEEFEFRLRMEQEAAQASAKQPASMLDKFAGGPQGRMLLGVASPALAVTQLMGEPGRNLVAGIEASKQRGMRHWGTEGPDWMGILGSLLPGAAMMKGVEKALPWLASAAGGVGVKGVAARAGLGAAQGATIAAATPSEGKDLWSEKLMQAGSGGLLGGAIPMAVDVGKAIGSVVKTAIEPMTEKGRDAILYRFRTEGLTPEQIRKAQQLARNAEVFVPGTKPTAAEALASVDEMGFPLAPEAARLIKHEEAIAKRIPSLFSTRTTDNEKARMAIIDRLAGTPHDLAAARGVRELADEVNYGLAFKGQVQSDDTLRELLSAPSMRKVFLRAAELAKDYGKPFQLGKDVPAYTVTSPLVGASGQPIVTNFPARSAVYPVESLHFVKLGLDDLIKNPERFGIGASKVDAIKELRGQFIAWLATKSKDYDVAKEAHRQLSGPINQMETAQYLQGILRSPLGDKERGAMLAKAVEEFPKTFRKATGQPRFGEKGIKDILGAQGASAVQGVIDDLARMASLERLGGRANLGNLTGAIPGEVGAHIPNLLSRTAMLTNAIMGKIGESAERKILASAGEQALNPLLYANSLTPPPPSRFAPLIDAILHGAVVPGGIAAGQLGRE